MTSLTHGKLLRIFSKDHLRGYRLGIRGKRLLRERAPERFQFYLSGRTDTNSIKSSPARRLRLHRIAQAYEHFYFLTNDYHGETLLWLLCRPDVIGQLNATLLQELQLPCRNAFIENDARTDAGAPILFCYLPDLPRLFRFLSALELLQMKGAILCFDFQAGALRPLCGDKVELQIIDFAEFERRFLTSP